MPVADHVVRALAQAVPVDARLLVAFSGGLDSSVLLHAAARAHGGGNLALVRAVHVNHGMNTDAARWAAHCAAVATDLGVPFRSVPVEVRPAGRGLEDAAREARYRVLRAQLAPGEWLAVAHHADDQLETVLLRLLRGSGPAGLAGMAVASPFGPGRLVRPFLHVDRAMLRDYARAHGIRGLDDPMNADPAFDRAWLRTAVLPPLRVRWPQAARAAGRASNLAAEAGAILDEVAVGDAGPWRGGDRLPMSIMRGLSAPRRANLLRFLARERGWRPPPEGRLRAGLDALLHAAPERSPLLAWDGQEIRRYRDVLYFLDRAIDATGVSDASVEWCDGAELSFGGSRGRLALAPGAGEGMALELVERGLSVTFRPGNAGLRLRERGTHRTLKFLCQTAGVVPWMRPHLPLVLAGGELAAVGDLWLADWARAAPGAPGRRIVWTAHPATH
jgi:tRNA(Ile)-lysidine synthase